MMNKRSVFVFPTTKLILDPKQNPYIGRLRDELSNHFNVINIHTNIGILDMVKKFFRTDIFYFNWIEDLPDKRYGIIQLPFLFLVLIFSKLFKKKIIWFIHNNVSHKAERLLLKKLIITVMWRTADLVLAHSTIESRRRKPVVKTFDHPIEENLFLLESPDYKYDLIIWGALSPYKGVHKFLEYNYNTDALRSKRILVVGKASSDAYWAFLQNFGKSNVVLKNIALPNEELVRLIAVSKCVLFAYTSNSVLSSGALCYSLGLGKTVIGPNIGSFKSLGEERLIYTYKSFNELPLILDKIDENGLIDQKRLANYVSKNRWSDFGKFISRNIG